MIPQQSNKCSHDVIVVVAGTVVVGVEYTFPGGGGGGHSGTEGGRTFVTYFAEEVRDFVKEGYFFVPRYEVWGSKYPYTPRNIRGSDAE